MDISHYQPPVYDAEGAMETETGRMQEVVPRRILEDRVAEGEPQRKHARPIREMSALLRKHRQERAAATGEEEPKRYRPRLLRRKKARPVERESATTDHERNMR
eukprot:4420679-Amphidinium_carterae.2